MENKTNSKITLEKFHDTVTGKDSFYVCIDTDTNNSMNSKMFDNLKSADEYYQKAIANKFVGTKEEILKEYVVEGCEQKDLISLEAELDVAYNKFKHVIRRNGAIIFSSNSSETAKSAYARLVEAKGKLFTYQEIERSSV